MNKQMIQRIGGTSALLGVMLGAFGAHALKAIIESHGRLETWETASFYHLIHAIAILLPQSNTKSVIFFCLGQVFFSGSLYVMSLTGMTWLGAVAPLGGISFMLGWVFLILNKNETVTH